MVVVLGTLKIAPWQVAPYPNPNSKPSTNQGAILRGTILWSRQIKALELFMCLVFPALVVS